MIFFYLCFFFPHVFFCRQEISSKVRDFLALPAKKKEKKKGKQKKENKEIIKPKTLEEGGGVGKDRKSKGKNRRTPDWRAAAPGLKPHRLPRALCDMKDA